VGELRDHRSTDFFYHVPRDDASACFSGISTSMFFKIFFLHILLPHRLWQVTTITEEAVPIPEVVAAATEAAAATAIKQSQTRASFTCILLCPCSDLRASTYRSSRYLFVETRQ
jgi:hypothetical protein